MGLVACGRFIWQWGNGVDKAIGGSPASRFVSGNVWIVHKLFDSRESRFYQLMSLCASTILL